MSNYVGLTKKAILKYPDIYEKELKDSKCLLSISVGQNAHEGDKLIATLIALKKHFKQCTVLVGDSLQRHTLALEDGIDLRKAHEKANLMGESWVKRNLPHIQKTSIPFDIIHWDYWLKHPLFEKYKSYVEDLYLNEREFCYRVNALAVEFLERHEEKYILSKISHHEILKSCKEYLREECAAMFLWLEDCYNFEIYPSQRNAAMSYIHENIISKEHPKLLQPISIKFKNLHPNIAEINEVID